MRSCTAQIICILAKQFLFGTRLQSTTAIENMNNIFYYSAKSTHVDLSILNIYVTINIYHTSFSSSTYLSVTDGMYTTLVSMLVVRFNNIYIVCASYTRFVHSFVRILSNASTKVVSLIVDIHIITRVLYPFKQI